jgi:hypothetical protein
VAFVGAGFIRCHFLRRLAASGRYARLYSVDIAEPRFTDPEIRYVNFDIRKPITAQLCGEGSFDIFNFAAIHMSPGHEDWEILFDQRPRRDQCLQVCDRCRR